MKPKSLTKSEISKRLSFSDNSDEESSDSQTNSTDQNVLASLGEVKDQGNGCFNIIF